MTEMGSDPIFGIHDTAVAIVARAGIDHLVIPALAGGRVVAARWIAVRFVLLSTLLMAGCFYTDRINQRPGIEIVQTSDDLVYRKSMVTLLATDDDPEDHVVFKQWHAHACTDATLPDNAGCDMVPFQTGNLDNFIFEVPSTRADTTTPVQTVRVVLEAQDDYGAIARPFQELLIPIANHLPYLDLRMAPRYEYLVDTPIDLFVAVTDADDAPASVQVEWKVYTPMNQPAYTLVDVDVPDPDPLALQLGKLFTPKGNGKWTIEVTATDPLGGGDVKQFEMQVDLDGPPCLAQWAPITAPSGSALPMTEPTLFRINVVTDVLDPFPTIPGDAQLGTTRFSWSIKPPGSSTRDALSVTSNQAALDPANYQPGDIVELRVEIQDRIPRTITCADNLDTCSMTSDNDCLQRLTWRVEVR
jgi:hypothetical protein